MKYDELQPVILLQETLKAIREDDIDELEVLLEQLKVEIPIWLTELRPKSI
jgi:hypothetical protein